MTPLDLTKAPPRSPRVQLDGLVMLPRMIDIARALLPGGNAGDYQIGRGLSGVIFRYFKADPDAFIGAVAGATVEEDVAAWLRHCNPEIENKRLSSLVVRIRVADVTEDLKEHFSHHYGDAHEPDELIVDILEKDDRDSFGRK